MKIKFSREIRYIPEWNGNRALPEPEQVVATIRPMQVGDLLLVMDAMGTKPGEQTNTDKIDVGRLLADVGMLLPKYVKIVNLEDEQGPVSVEEMMKFGAYVPLASELLMECARASMPSDTAEGNSLPPPA